MTYKLALKILLKVAGSGNTLGVIAKPIRGATFTFKNTLPGGPGTREKVRSKRINLEGSTHAQEINVSRLPV
jgi:hypothetical protein